MCTFCQAQWVIIPFYALFKLKYIHFAVICAFALQLHETTGITDIQGLNAKFSELRLKLGWSAHYEGDRR
jgi:hypothetical protein